MHFRKNQPVTEVFDSDFHHTFEVPTHLVVHIPPARLNITRLVFCRNYRPGEPNSCPMGDGCKFVHADIEASALQQHPIHVNYAYRSLEKCTYARLPAGETITVMAPNERPPTDEVPSERVLVTRGSLMRKEHNGPLSHCAHYYFNRMCNRGERCNFIHSVTVDPTVTSDFKRAPARSTHRTAQPAPLQSAPTTTAAVAPATKQPRIQQPHLVTPLPSAAVSSLSSVIDVTAAAVPLPLSSCQLRSTCSEDACCFSGDDEAGSCGCEDEECLALTNDFSPQGRWQGGCCAGGMCGCCSVANKTKSSHLTTMESLPNHRNMEVPKKPTTQQQPQQQQEHLERSDEEEEDDSIPPTLVAAPIPDRHRYRFNPYNRQRSVVLLGVA